MVLDYPQERNSTGLQTVVGASSLSLTLAIVTLCGFNHLCQTLCQEWVQKVELVEIRFFWMLVYILCILLG